ncbi:MAG TPA: hypothetical protein VFE61_21445 [Candidatus Sulfotelmatobacter sp.]|nr:hypothetical protein [Candidatus Sulfotelmatobacter sp.]
MSACCSWTATLADVGEKLSVSCQTVNAIEANKYDPSLRRAFKTAKIFRKWRRYLGPRKA